jgi:hypothetical protein
MCGHLLAEEENTGKIVESLDLGGEDLKSIAEAALRELGRGPQASAERPAPKPAGDQFEKPATAGIPAKPGARRTPTVRPRNGREKLILIASFLVTLVALLSILLGVFRPHVAPAEGTVAPIPGPTGTSPGAGRTGAGPQGEASPEENLPETSTAEAGNSAAAPASTQEEFSGEALRPGLNAIISRINKELGTGLATNDLVLTAAPEEKSTPDTVAQINFQTRDFSGSAGVLFRSYDYGWQKGWRLTHYRDVQITFASPVTLTENSDNGVVRKTISGASVGDGTYQPISALANQAVSYQ